MNDTDQAFLNYLTALNDILITEAVFRDSVSLKVEDRWVIIECQGLGIWRLVAKLHHKFPLAPHWGIQIWESGDLAVSLNRLGKWDFSEVEA